MRSTNDSVLINNTLNGDLKAFEAIVKKYHRMVFTLAIKILKNREEAEELAQDVFLKVYQSLSSFNKESKLSTWIYKICYNASINKYRSQKKRMETTELNGFTEHSISDTANAHHKMQTEEKKKAIKDSILKLPEADRIIITLYYYEDMSIKEIAAIVSLSTQNVKVKLYRSRKKLFLELKDKLANEKSEQYEY